MRDTHGRFVKGNISPMKGKHVSEEIRRKNSEAHMGQIAWNKGKKIQTNTGRTHFKKGHVCWLTGTKGIAKPNKTSFKKGHTSWIKGKEFTQIMGRNHPHWKGGKTINTQGYVLIKSRKHPFADKNGYVREHRLVMEKHLGRYLDPQETIHHINDKLSDNRIENLMLFSNNSEHIKFHHEHKEYY